MPFVLADGQHMAVCSSTTWVGPGLLHCHTQMSIFLAVMNPLMPTQVNNEVKAKESQTTQRHPEQLSRSRPLHIETTPSIYRLAAQPVYTQSVADLGL